MKHCIFDGNILAQLHPFEPMSLSKKIFATLSLVASFMAANAQLSLQDSLWQLIDSRPNDTLKVLHYLDLGMEYEMTQPDSAIIIYEKARDLSEALSYPIGYCRYANAVAYPLEILDRLDEKDSILFRAVALCEKHGLRRELARKYHSLGVSEQFRRNYEQSIEWYLKGLKIVDELKDSAMYTAFYNNLGSVFKGLGQNEKAYEYGEKALNIHRARGRKSGIASAQLNLGILDVRFLQYEKALMRYEEALKISEELEDYEGIVISRINMTDVLIGQKKYDEALRNVEACDSIVMVLNSARYKMLMLQAKGSALQYLKRYEESLTSLNEAENLAIQIGEKERLSAIYKEKSSIYEVKGDFENALANLKLHYEYADSVANEGIENNINELEVKYKAEKSERELLGKSLELEKQKSRTRQRGSMLIGAAIFFVVLIVLFFQRQRLNTQKLVAAQKQKELELVQMREHERSRIASDMHDDLGSGLTSIKLLSEVALRKAHTVEEQKDLEKISGKSNELVSKMSEIIWAMNPANDTLHNLVAYTRAYAAQFLDEANIKLQFESKIENAESIVTGEMRRDVFLVIKEILNNTVKYAEASAVTISLISKNSKLMAAIGDNGIGIDVSKARIGSQGIQGMKKRIENLNGSFEIKNDGGTHVNFLVPLL